MHGNQDGYAAIVRILLLFSIVFVQASCASSAGEPPTVNGNTVSTTDKHQPQSRKLALLVGIDKYQHRHIGNLNGAVNDVHSMKRLLVERFGFPDDNQHLRVLTNSDATRKAILTGIEEHLIAKADSDSIVVFHYSGHGSYLRDEQGEETDGRDETIVPHDSGHIDPYPNRDITDDELNALLHKLADKTPHVTFIFDSCHSGSAIRGAGLARTARPDERPPPKRRLAAGGATRGVSEGPNDLRPVDARYVLISGAMAQELSYELQMDGKSYGALSWYLTDEVRRAGANATYRDIMDVVKARVTARYPSQHPQLEGPGGNQLVFNTRSLAPEPFVLVSPRGRDTVTLDAGQVQGVTRDSVYAVYPPGSKSFTSDVEPVAQIKVSDVDVIWSSARVIKGQVSDDASRAVEREHHWPDAVLRVAFMKPNASQTLRQVENKLREFKHITAVESVSGYDLLLREHRHSSDGQRYIVTEGGDPSEISPRVPVSDANAVSRVVEQVTHWAKWFNIMQISNSHPDLGVKFELKAAAGTRQGGAPFANQDVDLTLAAGERLSIEITNTSQQNLYIALLDLSSDGSVAVVYPLRGGQEFIAPGKTWYKQLEAYLPPGRDAVRDVLKLIATTNYADFGFLQQEAVRGAPILTQTRGHTRNPLEELLANAAMGTTRGTRPVDLEDWVTVDKVLEVRGRK